MVSRLCLFFALKMSAAYFNDMFNSGTTSTTVVESIETTIANDKKFLNSAGDKMTRTLDMGNLGIVNVKDPINQLDVANKNM